MIPPTSTRRAAPAFAHAPRFHVGTSASGHNTALLLAPSFRRARHAFHRPRRPRARIVLATANAPQDPSSQSPEAGAGAPGIGAGAGGSASGNGTAGAAANGNTNLTDGEIDDASQQAVAPVAAAAESDTTGAIAAPTADGIPSAPLSPELAAKRARFKVQRRILVGVVMGVVVINFVFSPPWLFALGMMTISMMGLFEYYRMVQAKGHLPAYKMGLGVTAATMVSSALAPTLADVVFPVGGTMICIYLLFRRSKIATIADISTTFMGLFYAGYLPSFWVRLHGFAGRPVDNAVASAVASLWPRLFAISPMITPGALTVFWTWLAAASADIGAFFFGRTFGRTRFSNISPKKTVEGAIAGFLCSAGVSVLGAYLLRWPIWWATGAIYGITVGVLGLCGDLFESCFKRDVGWKDSSSLFPGHGGMLDRADSYILVAPLVYFFASMALPALGPPRM